MADKYLMALDLGTSGIRCLIFDRHGRMVSRSRQDYIYRDTPEIAPLGKEFDAEELWRQSCACIAVSLKSGGLRPGDIAGISATSQREGAVFLDAEGRELYAGPNIDLRAVMEGLTLDNQQAARIHAITGHLPSLLFVPARLLWFKNNRPEIFDRIDSVLTLGNWLLFRLCGVKAAEASGVVELGLGDVCQRKYSVELMASLGLRSGIFPELAAPGVRTGNITARASLDCGLAEGTAVVQGGPDTHCGLIGMGVREPGQVGVVSGWSTPLQLVTAGPVLDPQRRVWTGCHVCAGRWILESNCGESGRAWQWIRDNFFDQAGVSDGEVYAQMDRLAFETPAGAEGVLAFIGPEAMNTGNPGLRWGGFLFSLPFSASGVNRAKLTRAALENICYAVRANAQQLEAISGKKLGEVSWGGGLAASKCLKSILTAILDRPVSFAAVSETSGLGAAILAAQGSGIYSNLDEALAEMQSPLEICLPEALAAAEYREYYLRWVSLGRRLNEIGEELN